MKVVIVGVGNQGKKRKKILNSKDFIASIDPIDKDADFKDIKDVPLDIYDSCFLCVPDHLKKKLIDFCIKTKKNILVEKPLIFKNNDYLRSVERNCNKKNIVFYTAYNHRFEPNLMSLKKVLEKKEIGNIYYCKMFYGNGTSRLVKNNKWKNKKNKGVVSDLGSHLIDLCLFLFKSKKFKFERVVSKNFENKSSDFYVIKSSNTKIYIQLEMTLCMWKNTFKCDIIGKKGSIHVNNLCKWGPSKISIRKRILPSGKPIEINKTIKMNDPTWSKEHKYFQKLINQNKKNNLSNDIFINKSILNT